LSFGGGGQAAAETKAHQHSNAADDGGSLSTNSTLIANGSLYARILVGA
jgi:hypothetical protein|tara:strand:+ start:250 stop:396 length:147 start_codon:yes stop_codon:yes gene_type:complete